jgi:hypothetical protein
LEYPLELTFKGCDFNFIFALRLWSLAGAQGPFAGAALAGALAGARAEPSLQARPLADSWAAWCPLRVVCSRGLRLNPHLTNGYAVEVSKFFNIQPYGMQYMISRMVASGLTMEEARGGRGAHTETAGRAKPMSLLAA